MRILGSIDHRGPVLRLWLALVVVSSFAGCGNEHGLVSVTGRVTYKGEPLTSGDISFVPEEGGRAATGQLDSSGGYRLGTFAPGDGAKPGKHRVQIVSRGPDKPIPKKKQGKMMEEDMEGSGDALIPQKYFSVETSGLNAEVGSSGGRFDFDLKDN